MSKHTPLEEIEAGWDGFERPVDGDYYRHYKGGEYEIVATGFFEKSKTPGVAYRSLEKDIVWFRTAKNFLETVEYNGKTAPRFAKI